MKRFSELAVFLAVFGSLIMLVGAISYFGTRGQDQQLMNPRLGIFAHRQFLAGIVLFVLSWMIKLIVYWIDPSIPNVWSRLYVVPYVPRTGLLR